MKSSVPASIQSLILLEDCKPLVNTELDSELYQQLLLDPATVIPFEIRAIVELRWVGWLVLVAGRTIIETSP